MSPADVLLREHLVIGGSESWSMRKGEELKDRRVKHQEKHYNSLCYKKILKTLRYICITTEAQIVIG